MFLSFLELVFGFLVELTVWFVVDWLMGYWMFPFLSGRYDNKLEKMREEKWFDELYQHEKYGELIRENRRIGTCLLRKRKRRKGFFAREKDRAKLMALLQAEAN